MLLLDMLLMRYIRYLSVAMVTVCSWITISLHVASKAQVLGIYDISVCKTEILDPKNVENDILHATFGHILDEIQPTDSDVGHIGFLAQ